MTDRTPEPELVHLVPATTAVIRGVITMTQLRDFFDTSFRALAQTLAAQRVEPSSPAFALYHHMGDTIDLELGFATDRAVEPDGDVVPGVLPGGRIARLTHLGSYDQLGSSWQHLDSWVRAQGLTPRAGFWETYVTQPTPEMDPRDLRTELHQPIAD